MEVIIKAIGECEEIDGIFVSREILKKSKQRGMTIREYMTFEGIPLPLEWEFNVILGDSYYMS